MNTPKNNPNGKKWTARNSNISSMIFTILQALKNKPENKWKDNFEILRNFLDFYRIESDCWLLEEISKNWEITFDMIKSDGFDIEQIIGDNRHSSASTLHNVLNSSKMWELWKDMEKVIIEKLVEIIKLKVPNNLKASMNTEINNPRSLNELKTQLWNFLEYGDWWKNLGENLAKEIKDVRIENKDIVDGLIKDGKIWANDVDWNFKDWNAGIRKKIDKIITQEYLWGMRSSLEFLEKNFGIIKNTFNDFVPSMWWINIKYVYEKENVDEELLERIEEAQENSDTQEFDKLNFQAYIQSLQKKNKNLWNILNKLWENDFDFGKLDKEEQNYFLRESISARLDQLRGNNVDNLIWVNQSDFEKFAKDLFDLDQNEIVIDTAKWDIRLWVNKKIRAWKNINWMDTSEISEAKIPLEFDIKILDQDNDLLKNTAIRQIFGNEISEDGKSINLNSDNIWKLFMLYVLAQNSFDNRLMNEDNVKKLKELFEDKVPATNNNADITDEFWNKQNWTWIESKEKTSEQEFLETWDTMKGYQFPDSRWKIFDWKEIWKWFEIGSRLWIKTWFDTELPPKDVWWDQWIQLKIIDINNSNFTVQLEWWELSAGDLEGKKITYPKTKDSLDKTVNAFNGDVYKLPRPEKWESSLWKIKEWWLENIDWWIWVFDDIEIKWWKFTSRTIEWNPQITHFGSVETKLDKNDLEQKENINYEINFKNNWMVEVKYKNYKRNMDYNNFIIFVSTKRLKPKTKEEAEIEIQNNPNPWTWKTFWFNLQFFSIKNIINTVKKIGNNINDWMKKHLEKTDKKLFNKMMWDWRMANKLRSVIGRIPWMWAALENMDSEYQNNIDKETWEKTEAILKVIEWHNDFGAIFDDETYMNHLLWWKSFKSMILSWEIPWGLSKNNDKRFVASAILLAIIKKWPWPYFKMWSKRYKWIWVKLLLWEPHYTRFMNAQKALIEEMKAKQWLYWPGYDAQMATELARSEMTFLINNIWWRAQWQSLGVNTIPKDWRIDGDTWPKDMRSDQFAWELENRFNEFISKDKIKEWSDKLWNVYNFTYAYWEFTRFLTSDRPTKCLPLLERMWDLAKSPEQIKKFIWAISYGMLTWFFLHHTTPSTQTWIQTKCRTFWFTPWMRANHIDQQKKLAYFFSKVEWKSPFPITWYNLSDFEFWKEIKNVSNFVWKFENRRNDNHNNAYDLLKNKMSDDKTNDPIFAQLKKASMEEQQEDIDENISKNSKLMSQFPLQQTKWTIRKISNYDNWSFRWNVDEIQRSQDVWNAISKAIKSNTWTKWQLIFNTQRLLNRFDEVFDETWKADFVKTLYTIKKYKWLMSWWKYTQHYWNIPIWNIFSKDLENMLRYNFNWKIFSRWTPPPEFSNAISAFASMFFNNIDQIDNDFIKKSFGEKYESDFSKDKSYQLIPWDLYFRLRDYETNQLDLREREFKKKFWSLKRTDLYINEDMYDSYRRLKWRMACPPLWWDRTQYSWIEWME